MSVAYTNETISPELAEKIHALLAANRVHAKPRGTTAIVCGSSAWWTVRATPWRVECNCPAGMRGRRCCHAVAAMAKGAEVVEP